MSQEAVREELIRIPRGFRVPARNFQGEFNQGFYMASSSSSSAGNEGNQSQNLSGEDDNVDCPEVEGSFGIAQKENVETEPKGADMLKVMTMKSMVRLENQPSKSGSHERKELTGSIYIKWDGIRFCKMKFGMSFKDDVASLTVCLLKSQKPEFYNDFKFQSCTIVMKFRSEKPGMELFKAIHVEGKDVCLDFEHNYDAHIASVTNKNFSDLASLKPFFAITSLGQLLGLQMEMSMELNVRVSRKKHESRTYVFNYPGGPLKQRRVQSLEQPWLKRMRMEDIHTDLVIKVGQRLLDTFRAHRCVLGVQSSVLDEILPNLTGPPYELKLPHVEAKTMDLFLSIIYEEHNKVELPKDFKLIFDVLELANEFKVAGVTNHCVQHLVSLRSEDHTVSSVLLMHLKACQLNISDLQLRALQVACKKKEAMRSPEGEKALEEFCQEHPVEAAKYSNGILGIT